MYYEVYGLAIFCPSHFPLCVHFQKAIIKRKGILLKLAAYLCPEAKVGTNEYWITHVHWLLKICSAQDMVLPFGLLDLSSIFSPPPSNLLAAKRWGLSKPFCQSLMGQYVLVFYWQDRLLQRFVVNRIPCKVFAYGRNIQKKSVLDIFVLFKERN